ncbi:MAG: hypothetical protein J3K34DRAFT_403889 [Monoraphidium minutum]|nr:MAG: hypothetical protein J3K34DRAFT_403889 [Monoraphidium minutum]
MVTLKSVSADGPSSRRSGVARQRLGPKIKGGVRVRVGSVWGGSASFAARAARINVRPVCTAATERAERKERGIRMGPMAAAWFGAFLDESDQSWETRGDDWNRLAIPGSLDLRDFLPRARGSPSMRQAGRSRRLPGAPGAAVRSGRCAGAGSAKSVYTKGADLDHRPAGGGSPARRASAMQVPFVQEAQMLSRERKPKATMANGGLRHGHRFLMCVQIALSSIQSARRTKAKGQDNKSTARLTSCKCSVMLPVAHPHRSSSPPPPPPH